MFEIYEYDLVIYDETEVFRDYFDDEFDYPYEKRKTVVKKVPMKPEPVGVNYPYESV